MIAYVDFNDHLQYFQVEEMGTPQSRVAWGTSTLPKDYRVKQMYL